MKNRWVRKIPIVIAIASLAIFAFSGAVMLLWNGVLTAVLHVGMITFWQAAGILLLSKILFGGFKGRGGMRGGHCRKKVFGKWEHMSAEEKEMFASRMNCHRRGDRMQAENAA